MAGKEKTAYELKGVRKYAVDGQFVDMPAGWEFVPSGNPALTRRLKAAVSEYWVVKRKVGSREFGIGLCVPGGMVARFSAEIQAEHATPEYQRRLEAGRRRRAREQVAYQADFQTAVLQFLAFHERYREVAVKMARVVTEFTTPVGSGTVARTQRIPIEERARAAVIAWMRHNTSDYDRRYIPNVAGRRREVRREIARESLALLRTYREGGDVPGDCPLQKALAAGPDSHEMPKRPVPVVKDEDDFWIMP